MTMIAEIAIAALLVVGGLFGLIGSYGLLKLRAPMQRLHAPTKATTIGVGSALIASSFDLIWVTGVVTWQEVLVAIFLFMTAPISALFLSKAHLCGTVDRNDVALTGTDADWSTVEKTKLNLNPEN